MESKYRTVQLTSAQSFRHHPPGYQSSKSPSWGPSTEQSMQIRSAKYQPSTIMHSVSPDPPFRIPKFFKLGPKYRAVYRQQALSFSSTTLHDTKVLNRLVYPVPLSRIPKFSAPSPSWVLTLLCTLYIAVQIASAQSLRQHCTQGYQCSKF